MKTPAPLIAIFFSLGLVSVASANSPPANESQPASTVWGGELAQVELSSGAANFLFHCARGNAGEPVVLDSNGHFALSGTYALEGGPIIAGDPRRYPAIFSGTMDHDQMQLAVNYRDREGQIQTLDFTLTSGSRMDTDYVCPR